MATSETAKRRANLYRSIRQYEKNRLPYIKELYRDSASELEKHVAKALNKIAQWREEMEDIDKGKQFTKLKQVKLTRRKKKIGREKKDLNKERAIIVRNINHFYEIRERLKLKYGMGTPEYRKVARELYNSIGSLKKKLNRLNQASIKVKELARAVHEFAGIPPIGNPPKHTMYLPNQLYYKYGMEHNMNGYHLRAYIGAKSKRSPGKTRMSFTRSFKEKPHNKDAWERFKIFMGETSNQFG